MSVLNQEGLCGGLNSWRLRSQLLHQNTLAEVIDCKSFNIPAAGSSFRKDDPEQEEAKMPNRDTAEPEEIAQDELPVSGIIGLIFWWEMFFILDNEAFHYYQPKEIRQRNGLAKPGNGSLRASRNYEKGTRSFVKVEIDLQIRLAPDHRKDKGLPTEILRPYLKAR
ncbi:hypothetical protein RND71_012136 [Anisodus tanguticus]|uniref:Uncharacterized protein n=1 Tax=Anisodus tanguticus TaxID=243964 RepID=A0AAE1SF52_9SOLA|nr:hypothetical protein RND71_012136 [Anisodus tanguticus]